MRTRAQAPTAGSTTATPIARLVLAALSVALLLGAFVASSAQAVTYTTGTPLSTGKVTSSVAVNQSTREVYAASAGAGSSLSEAGGFKRFSSAGSELACVLDPSPSRVLGVAVDPRNGNLDLTTGEGPLTSGRGRLRSFGRECGAEKALVSGTATTSAGSTSVTGVITASGQGTLSAGSAEVTGVSTSTGEFLAGQTITGEGIPASTTITAVSDTTLTLSAPAMASGSKSLSAGAKPFAVDERINGTGLASATGIGNFTESSKVVTGVSTSTGAFAVGETLYAGSLATPAAGASIAAILSPSELELSEAAIATVSAAAITAYTTVTAVSGQALTISPAATASGAAVAVSGAGLPVETGTLRPIAQPTTDEGGNVYFPNSGAGKLQKFTAAGAEVTGAHLPITGLSVAFSAALDSSGRIYVAHEANCHGFEESELREFQPDGTLVKTIFGEEEEATTVAVNRKTNDVYVGFGCGESFRIQQYSPSGVQLAEFGSGVFASPPPFVNAVMNQLAIDETSGTVYVADGGNGQVQVFTDASDKKTLGVSTGGTGSGSVKCNSTTCQSEYDEGEEITAAASAAVGSEFVKWATATGSASACAASTSPTCTFTIDEASTLKAEFKLPITPPTVTTTAGASEIAQETAKVSGTVNPNGDNVSNCEVEYGTSVSYGSVANCASLPGSGNSPVGVSAALSGLSPNTTYHFRFTAENGGGKGNGEDQEFITLPEAPAVQSEAATSISKTTATVNGTVNPHGGEVTECKFEYGTSVSYGSEASCETSPGSGESPVAVSANLSGLSAGTTYHFRLVAKNSGGTTNGADKEFTTTSVIVPAVTTTAGATEIAQSTAKVAGTVNPNGVAVSECEVLYGLTASYGSAKPCASLPGSGNSPVGVSASLSGLIPNTTYHFRFIAKNAEPATGEGADQTFTTLPNAPAVTTTAGASEIAQTSAKVSGTVNPNGGEVSKANCKVEYGPTASYGSEAECGAAPGSGNSPVAVSASLSGLTANTTYHFRFKATNGGGTGTGSDQEFKTLPLVPTLSEVGSEEIAQTSAKLKAKVNPNGATANCSFEYGTTASYGQSAPCSPSPGSGESPVSVSASITGLSPHTTYHFRVATSNSGGASNSTDQTLTTLPFSPTVSETGSEAIAQTTAKLKGKVNPNGGAVSSCKFEYGTTASYGQSANCSPSPGSGESPVAVSASISSLSANTTYHFRLVATNAGGTANGPDQELKTLPLAPSVVTTAGATEIAQSTAKVAGTVNPNGGNVTECEVEYGPSISYGSKANCASLPGSGESPVAVSASLSGLEANKTYHFRFIAKNAGGKGTGADQTFKTLPNAPTVLTTAGASPLAQTTATVGATVNPNSSNVSECEVQYGLTASYGSKASCASLPGSGSSPVGVSAALSGLAPNTTYHFRFVATNAGGTGEGADRSFTTLANTCATDSSLCPPPPVPTPAPVPTPTPKPLHCKKGFKKKTVGGKAKCVKVRKHHRKGRH